MTLRVFDTDIVSLYQRGHPVLSQRILASPPTELAIPVITVEEQLSGWYALIRRVAQRDRLAIAYQKSARFIEACMAASRPMTPRKTTWSRSTIRWRAHR